MVNSELQKEERSGEFLIAVCMEGAALLCMEGVRHRCGRSDVALIPRGIPKGEGLGTIALDGNPPLTTGKSVHHQVFPVLFIKATCQGRDHSSADYHRSPDVPAHGAQDSGFGRGGTLLPAL